MVVLRGGPADERFMAQRLKVPGIFRPVAVPAAAGPRRLLVEVALGGATVTHDLGDVQVFESVEAARRALPDTPDPAGRIQVLKEQQWQVEFGTEAATERAFRPSIAVTGTFRARHHGPGALEVAHHGGPLRSHRRRLAGQRRRRAVVAPGAGAL